MSDASRAVKICLLGFGNVGRRFCELVERKSGELAGDHGVRVLFAAVGTGSHGSLLAPDGLTAAEMLAVAHGGDIDLMLPDPPRPGTELIAAAGADVLVEATPLDPLGGHAAIEHIEAAFARGMDVVTVNKGPIAWDYRRLADIAAANGCGFRFEGTVMDGAPVFNMWESCLPGCRLLGFDAIFNATTNFILDAMGEGRSFADALTQTQADGYAESDPSHDIDGHDAAAKAAALANVLMDARITPDAVDKESVRDVTPERAAAARRAGRRLRVLCTAFAADLPAQRAAPGVRASVRLVELAPEHPFFAVGGSSLAVILHTDLMGDVEVAELAGLPEQTAFAVYSDLLALQRGR
jgi:homoserine dehydrogenase